MKFQQYLQERFINLLPGDESEKQKHAEHVFGMLKKAYEPIGGIHGSGFKSPEDMVKNIPMWKMHHKDGKVRAVSLYKDKEGRKRVAVATDGTAEGKAGLANMMRDDLKQHRSYGELSGPSLSFLKKQLPAGEMHKHLIPREHVAKISGEEIRNPPANDAELQKHPDLKDHLYQRKIGDEWHTKVMLGTVGKKITA